MLPGFHCRSRLFRMEIRRTLDHHSIQFLVQQPFVSRKPSEPALPRSLEFLADCVHAVLKIICRGHQVITTVLLE